LHQLENILYKCTDHLKEIRTYSVGKIVERAVWRSVFLTTWHCIFECRINKNTPSDCFFRRFCPLGIKNMPAQPYWL